MAKCNITTLTDQQLVHTFSFPRDRIVSSFNLNFSKSKYFALGIVSNPKFPEFRSGKICAKIKARKEDACEGFQEIYTQKSGEEDGEEDGKKINSEEKEIDKT